MGSFIPDPSRPHLRYPSDFKREADRERLVREADMLERRRWAINFSREEKKQLLKRWNMTLTHPNEMKSAHSHLIAQASAAKKDVIRRLESGDRDWAPLRATLARYIDFQTAADVVSGQTLELDRR